MLFFVHRDNETCLLHLEHVARKSNHIYTRLCIYISVLFSDIKKIKPKQKTKTKREPARRPQTHAYFDTDTCSVAPFSEPVLCCPVTVPKVQGSCFQVRHLKQISLSLQKVEAAFKVRVHSVQTEICQVAVLYSVYESMSVVCLLCQAC